MRQLFRQFSYPGGIPSHAAPETPGSINEGGELGYSLMHAYGAAFDNPDLLVACVIGDGEAETGPLAASLALEQVPRPGRRRRGAADPAPQRLQDRQPDRAGPDPRAGAARPDARVRLPAVRARGRARRRPPRRARADGVHNGRDPRSDRRDQARGRGRGHRPSTWPMLVLRSPKGWTGPRVVDGVQVEGTFRSHQVPLAGMRDNPEHLAELEQLAALVPAGGAVRRRRHAAAGDPRDRAERAAADERQPARQRRDAAARPAAARLPRLRGRRGRAGPLAGRGDQGARHLAARRDPAQPDDVPADGPGRDRVQPADPGVRGDRPGLRGRAGARRRPPRAARAGHGGAVGAPVPGLAGGLPAHRPARAVQLLRGVHPHRRLDVQPARQVAGVHIGHPVAAAGRVAELPAVQPRLAAGP